MMIHGDGMRANRTGHGIFRAVALSSAAALASMLAFGCSDTSTHVCTTELRTAVSVSIDANGLPISSVTATNQSEAPCTRLSASEASPVEYACYEQGGGIYVIRVSSGSETWTKSVTVAADECHTTEQKNLAFVLESDTAD